MRATVSPRYRTRTVRRRTLTPMTGQLFEIHVARSESRWAVTVPELDATVHVAQRIEAESAAREAIAVRTGIPIGFVAVWVRD